jgi:hypothetical protein
MKQIFILLILSFSIAPLFAQKKNEISANKIKCVVVTQEKTDKGKTLKEKDSETCYDVHGNVTEEKEFKDGKIKSQMTYQYDKDNNRIKETELNGAGKVMKVIENKYQNDLKIKETESDGSGKVIKVTEYKYDGNLRSEKIVYDDNGKVKSRKTYAYQKY